MRFIENAAAAESAWGKNRTLQNFTKHRAMTTSQIDSLSMKAASSYMLCRTLTFYLKMCEQ